MFQYSHLYLLFSLCLFELCSFQVIEVPVFVNESALIPRIVEGVDAELGDVPYQVALKEMVNRQKKLYDTFCGGTILSRSKVLSAAHCFDSVRSRAFTCCGDIRILGRRAVSHLFAVAGTIRTKGTYKGEEQEQWKRIRKVIYPISYNFPDDDIAVVVTPPYRFNEFVSPIPYAREYMDYSGVCLASGFGNTKKGREVFPDKLQLAWLQVMPAFWCNKAYQENMQHFVCTPDQKSDIGKGDSGGPLVCYIEPAPNEEQKAILIGVACGMTVVEFGTSVIELGSLFTRVSSYVRFIEENDANTCHCMSIYFVVVVLVHSGLYIVFLFDVSWFLRFNDSVNQMGKFLNRPFFRHFGGNFFSLFVKTKCVTM
ncbi:hypothetical protein ABMA27_004822 [Loxostege sticticalis]|uniref:Peptidase S1 domain-containing protein n=1 Tax=Loxostege sticticalis TaxID=481309 RepID=A0ABR3HKR9_LOXSC